VPARTVDCALAHAGDRATAARASLLRPFIDPDDFAARLVHTLHGLLASTGRATVEDIDTRHLTAGVYRWQDVRLALIDAARRPGADTGPHPLTAAWRERGLTLPGDTVGEQLSRLKSSPLYVLGQDEVSVGDLATSGFTEAVRELTGGTDAACLADALDQACLGPGLAELIDQISNLIDGTGSGAAARG
jgi:uncharacterized protein